MLHRGIAFAHVATVLVALLVAFLVTHKMDEDSLIGHHAVVHARGEPDVSTGRAVDTVERVARSERVNIGLLRTDLTDPGNHRQLYLATGDPDAASTRWPATGYPGFNAEMRTDVSRLAEVRDGHADGYYLVFGNVGAAEELRAALEEQGFTATMKVRDARDVFDYYLSVGAIRWAILITAAAVALLVGLSVLLNAKCYGVQRSQGRSFVGMLFGDLRRLLLLLARVVPLLVGAVLGCLAVYNRLHHAAVFGGIAAAVAGTLALVAVLAHVLALALVCRTRIVDAVKGAVSARLVLLAAYAVRIPAVVVATTVAVSALGSWQTLERQQASHDRWVSVGGTARITLSGTALAGPTDEEKLVASLGPWLRHADRDGTAVISARFPLYNVLPADSAGIGGDVLVVNDAYLSRQRVSLDSGRRVRPAPGDRGVRVLVPPRMRAHVASVTAGVGGWVADFDRHEPTSRAVTLDTLRGGQSLFTYGSLMEVYGDATVRDAVVVVLPSSGDLLDDDEYVSYATSSSLVFPHPADPLAAQRTELGSYINGVQPVARYAADEYRAFVTDFRFDLVNLVAVLAVLSITSVGVGIMFSRRNAQEIFARFLGGWSFLGTYWRLIAVELGVAAAVVWWIGWTTAARLGTLRAGVDPFQQGEFVRVTGVEPAAAVLVVAIGFGGVLATVGLLHRRFVREVSAHA